MIVLYIVALNSIVYAGEMINLNLVYDGVSHKYSAEEINIEIDGKMIEDYTVPPIVLNDRTLVPARAVLENMGADVVWNDAEKEVYITKDNNIVVLKINQNIGTKNGIEFLLDVPAKIINDSTFIPVRAVSEILGSKVSWDGTKRLVSIYQNDYIDPEEEKEDDGKDSSAEEGETPSKGESDSQETEQNNSSAEIKVIGLDIPKSVQDTQVFKINASDTIEKYEKTLVGGNRLAIDIYNANMNILNTNLSVSTSRYISSVRSSQFQVTPQKITRVVFDLKTSTGYNLSLSSDKKSIIIKFEESIVDGISFSTEKLDDLIYIKGGASSDISVTKSDQIITAIIKNTKISDLTVPSIAGSNYITDLTVTQSQADIRLEIFVDNSAVDAEITQVNDDKILKIHKTTYENVSYDSSLNAFVLAKRGDISSSGIMEEDDYLNCRYIFTLPGDYSEDYGFGSFSVNNASLANVEISKDTNGNTTLTFNEKNILAFNIIEDDKNIYFKHMSPKEKYSKIVVLDAGHGKNDPGTSGNGLTEKDINLDILIKVYDLFSKDKNVKVYATRLSDTYPENSERAKMANDIADLFVSIHQNSASPNTIPNGTEILYMNKDNEVSGKLTSKIAAQFAQKYIIPALGTTDRGIKERPDLIVLNQTKVPAILIETLFLSNPSDAEKIRQESYKDKAAQAIYSAIVDMMSQYPVR